MKRRVVVTGLGAVTPIGNTVEEFWNGIKAGKVGIGEITKFDTTEYKVVGTCATSRTMDDSNWLPSYGPAFAGYDGSNTILYGWKGTSSTVKKLNNVVNIDYIPE